MSYILDALKKSEQERRQPQRSGAVDLDAGLLHLRRRRTPFWIYVLVIVFGLNLALLAGLYLDRPDTAPEPTLTPTAPIQRTEPVPLTMATVATESVAEPVRQESSAPVTAIQSDTSIRHQSGAFTYIAATSAVPAAVSAPAEDADDWTVIRPEQTTTARAEPVPAPAPMVPESAPEPPVTRVDETPLLQEMAPEFVRQIPAISFNSHIYSQHPSARRVMINNIYLREGEGFSGVVVREIGETHIVFETQGQRFRLPVMKDWRP
jgi:general secretion pathway protein B